MVDIATPTGALLVALNNQFSAARQGRDRGRGSAIPGIPLTSSQESGAVQPLASLASALGGGGFAGSPTTGQSVANALVGGEIPETTGDPVADQVANTLLSRMEPGERGDLGAGVTGGNVGALLSVLGGPLAPASILASLVASNALGRPLDPSLLSVTSLAQLASADPAPSPLGSLGIPFEERETGPSDPGNISTTPRTNIGSGGIPFSGREIFNPFDIVLGGSDRSGNRGQSGVPALRREPLTGRVAGPV